MELLAGKQSATLIPQQPHLSSLPRYQERLIQWNPYSRKNNALCYQFETRDERQSLQLIPDGCVNFLFCCNKTRPTAFVSGIHVALQEQALEPRSLYFGFKPFCSTSFKPAGSSWPELIEQTVPLQDLLGSANQILERLSIARSFSERIWAIRSFTRERIIDSDYVPDLVEFAEQKLCAAHGAVSIETMGDYTCYSNRYCRERFKDACGISQKSYANIMRFQNAVRMLASVDPKQKPRLADVIVENGYFDQSHLNREFRRFVNSTPRRFFQTLGLR